MNKDIFFYSEYCDYSKEVRTQLDTYGQLPKMISVCVDDENIQLPPFLEAVPTIYLNENKSILVDESIEKYINKFKPNEQQNSIGDSAVISCRPADLISDNYNEIVGSFNSALIEKDLKIDCSDENILTYAMFPEIGLAFLEHQSDPDFFETEPADIFEQTDSSYLVSIDDKEYSVVVKSNNSVEINGSSVKSTNEQPSHPAQAGLGSIINAPLGGNIFKLIAQEGQSLEPDATVLILEAMKMETEIKSPAAGVVTKIFVKPGDSVKPGDPLFEIA